MQSLQMGSSILEEIRQKSNEYRVEEIVLDFLSIWEIIHKKAPELKPSDMRDYAKSIYKDITAKFCQKYSKYPTVEKHDAWIKNYSSIILNWIGRGRIMFPLRLITYEVFYHDENLFNYYIKRLTTKQIVGTSKELFEFLFPKLYNFAIPLEKTDIIILKGLQTLQRRDIDNVTKNQNKDLANNLDISLRTIQRRLNLLQFYQLRTPMSFIDLAQLGYETFLCTHLNPIPKSLSKYVTYSADLAISKFSLLHVPLNKPKDLYKFRDMVKPDLFHQMDHRTHLWNLGNLTTGKNGWKVPPPILHGDPKLNMITPSPDFEMNLIPEMDGFRKLTRADLEIIEFISSVGDFKSTSQLSQTIKVSLSEVSSRLNELNEKRILSKIYQFYNIGLDLTISIFISSPTHTGINWQDHFMTFPKSDICSKDLDDSSIYFGHIKLPIFWIKDFTRKMKSIKKEFPSCRIHYTIEPPDIAKWNISLKETYS